MTRSNIQPPAGFKSPFVPKPREAYGVRALQRRFPHDIRIKSSHPHGKPTTSANSGGSFILSADANSRLRFFAPWLSFGSLGGMTRMKTYRWKLAGWVFFAIAALDAVLLVLNHLISGCWLVGISWWLVNFPSLPLVYFALPHMAVSGLFPMLIGASIFSAVLWSGVAGYVFRHKYIA